MLSGADSFRSALPSSFPLKHVPPVPPANSKTPLSSPLLMKLELWGVTRWLRRQRYAAEPGNLSSIPGAPHGRQRELASCQLSCDLYTYTHVPRSVCTGLTRGRVGSVWVPTFLKDSSSSAILVAKACR